MSSVIIPSIEETTVVDTATSSIILTNSVVNISGGAAETLYTAGADLGGHRVVVLDSSSELQYATNTDLTMAERVLGMTSGAIAAGETATVVHSGEVTEPSWNWTLGSPIFLGVTGQLTQIRPTTSGTFVLQVAFPITPTQVYVDIKQAFFI